MSGGTMLALLIAGALGYLAAVSSASEKAKPPPKPPGCDFCRDNDRIIVYRESAPRELRVGDFCPVCGRRLPTPPTQK